STPEIEFNRQQLSQQPVPRRPGGVTKKNRRIGLLVRGPGGLKTTASLIDPQPLRQRQIRTKSAAAAGHVESSSCHIKRISVSLRSMVRTDVPSTSAISSRE